MYFIVCEKHSWFNTLSSKGKFKKLLVLTGNFLNSYEVLKKTIKELGNEIYTFIGKHFYYSVLKYLGVCLYNYIDISV